MEQYYHIRRASYLGSFMIHIEFDNGDHKILDCNSWLNENMGDFEDLKIESNFKQFEIKSGLLTWPNGYDLAPEYSYQSSKPYIFEKGRQTFVIT
ncbi:MAG: DUF2442 domain-containing protein [Ignavibacteriaceae bacterium]|nr:DUF2442 domain-containing protein [Ignavibacteriaceae bacterium]